MKNTLPADLMSLGLSDKEATIYLALLGRGTATVQDLAFDTGVKRTTIYPVLTALQEKGLVSTDITRRKKAFAIGPVSTLRELIRRKIGNFESTLKQLEKLEHESAHTTRGVKYFRGITAVKGLYEGILTRLKPSHFYWAISNQDQWFSGDTSYFVEFKRRRSLLKIDVRLLLTPSAATQRNKEIAATLSERIRILPAEATISTNTIVTPFCYALHSLDPTPSAVCIEIPAIVQSQTEVFRLLWGAASSRSVP